MHSEFNEIAGRIGIFVAVMVFVLAALALYFYSDRAAPPRPEPEAIPEAVPVGEIGRQDESGTTASAEAPVAEMPERPEGPVAGAPGPGDPASDTLQPSEAAEPEISLDLQDQELREDLAVRLGPGQLEIIADERLLERLVTTVNSLDGAPVPLRFRPLAHVPGLPLLEREGDALRLPGAPDPRYRPYLALFDRLDAVEMAELFDRYEPALEQAWQDLGENPGQTFRQRAIELLEHLADFELPASRPSVHQPKVLFEYIDSSLEQLSWGRKILLRIGPAQAPPVQRKLAALAERLASRAGQNSGADR